MKLKELKNVLYSTRDHIQFAIVFDSASSTNIENGCSIDYAVQTHGEREVKHIEAFESQLLITV